MEWEHRTSGKTGQIRKVVAWHFIKNCSAFHSVTTVSLSSGSTCWDWSSSPLLPLSVKYSVMLLKRRCISDSLGSPYKRVGKRECQLNLEYLELPTVFQNADGTTSTTWLLYMEKSKQFDAWKPLELIARAWQDCWWSDKAVTQREFGLSY